MKPTFRLAIVITCWMWVVGMFALGFGSRALEHLRPPTPSEMIQPKVVKTQEIRKPPEPAAPAAVKSQERYEPPFVAEIKTSVPTEPAEAAPATASPAPKAKFKRIIRKAPKRKPPEPKMVGGQPL